jgi:type I restriction enzyme S subunit
MRARLNALDSYQLLLPPSKEQVRIAEKLDEVLSDLEAGAAALERARANLKRYRASVLKAAVEGRLTEKWRAAHPKVEPASKLLERILARRRKRWEEAQLKKYDDKDRSPPKGWKEKYPEPVKPEVDGLPELPEGWCWASLDQLAEIVGGITKGQKRRQDEATRAVPYLRVANVQRGYLDLSEVKLIEATEDEIRELRLVKGDVLFNEGGDRDKLGRGWVWEEQIPECIHQNHVFRARLVGPGVLPKFVSIHGNTFGRRWFQQAGKQSVNLASINMGILKRFPVPLAPGQEQEVAISLVDQQLSVLDRSASIVEQEEVRSDRLRQAILKRAFEGQLVPQDPTDEPASELLARIRATGAGEGKAQGRGRRIGGKTAR